MKHLVMSGCLLAVAALAACTSGGSGGRYLMRVDRTFDRGALPQPSAPDAVLPGESYRTTPPADRWEVAIEGSTVVLTPIEAKPGFTRMEGTENKATSTSGERHFDLGKGAFAGGRFIVRGDDAELTVFGSGVPIVSSERGKLVTR